MKKSIIIPLAAFLVLAGVVLSLSLRRNHNPFFNGNIEALMDVESGEGECFKAIHTSAGERVLYCGSCTWQPGAPDFFSGKGKC